MQRTVGGGLSPEQVKELEAEEARTAKWNILISVAGFIGVISLLRIGKNTFITSYIYWTL